jgi:hypothetical protein
MRVDHNGPSASSGIRLDAERWWVSAVVEPIGLNSISFALQRDATPDLWVLRSRVRHTLGIEGLLWNRTNARSTPLSRCVCRVDGALGSRVENDWLVLLGVIKRHSRPVGRDSLVNIS